jgi:hypothetical protein
MLATSLDTVSDNQLMTTWEKSWYLFCFGLLKMVYSVELINADKENAHAYKLLGK